jgi:hyaluronoglucosaminidase
VDRGQAVVIAGAILALTASTAAGAVDRGAAGIPAVFPTPQSLVVRGAPIAVPATVALVAPRSADPAAVASVETTLTNAGAVVSRSAAAARLTVYLGRNPRIETALRVRDAHALPAGGYVLVAGRVASRSVIVLDGADAAGSFYAAVTFDQLLNGRRTIPALAIRDWPSFGSRGVVEGFYGAPWSQPARLAALDYLGRHKLNLYMYLPKDDPNVRAGWRTPFTSSALSSVRTLVARAARNHVTFNYGLSPGDSICYSAPEERAALIAKLQSLARVGVRSFTLAFDDIDVARLPCLADVQAYGVGTAALAAAQSALVTAVAGTLAGSKLVVVPTEYSGVESTGYKQTLAAGLPPGVTVQWTGLYPVSTSIASADATAASAAYGHPLLLWDNYFVNDLLPGYLVLGPYAGRDATLSQQTQGVTIDPMNEAELSHVGMFTTADFAWNPTSYDPARSWTGALREIAGPDPVALAALRTFASANYGSPLAATQAPALVAAMDDFWRRWYAGDPNAGGTLGPMLRRLRDAPATIRARAQDTAFLEEAKPWLDATEQWGTAAVAALDLLSARKNGQTERAAADEQAARASRERATLMVVPNSSPPASIRIAGGALSDFVHYALRGYGP